jgi:preprotein translocase subunit SecG
MSPLHIFLLVTFAFVCFLLIASVLLQTGKGGGMAGLGGGSSDTAFGAHTANVLQKFTMYCVIAFFILVVALSHMSKRQGNNTSVMDNFIAPTEKEIPADIGGLPKVSAEAISTESEAAAAPTSTPETSSSTPETPAVPATSTQPEAK